MDIAPRAERVDQTHALGGVAGPNIHHGTLNAILLPHVLEFNAPAVAERYGAIRQAMKLPARADLPNAVHTLREKLNLPSRLSELGVDRETIERAAPLAEKDHSNRTNPRRAKAEDYREIMAAAL